MVLQRSNAQVADYVLPPYQMEYKREHFRTQATRDVASLIIAEKTRHLHDFMKSTFLSCKNNLLS